MGGRAEDFDPPFHSFKFVEVYGDRFGFYHLSLVYIFWRTLSQ